MSFVIKHKLLCVASLICMFLLSSAITSNCNLSFYLFIYLFLNTESLAFDDNTSYSGFALLVMLMSSHQRNVCNMLYFTAAYAAFSPPVPNRQQRRRNVWQGVQLSGRSSLLGLCVAHGANDSLT